MKDHTFALWVRLKAKDGRESDLENFLQQGLPLALEEPATTAWFALRIDPATFGIFDTFPNEAGREAHLSGRIAAALVANAPHLLAEPPRIEKIDVLTGFCRSLLPEPVSKPSAEKRPFH